MIGKNKSHYRILEKLDEGGMGVVYKAEDTKLKRHVALKFLPPHLTRDKEANERFIQEAQAASALDHQNICTIHEINETAEGQMYIVMTCYEGETLKQKIKKGPLEIDEAINIAVQISEGLAKAHQKGIVHRDIKPANMMLTTDGVVKILDFGLAKLAGTTRITKAGSTMGTVAYMSPEQARGKEADERTDIWSLGVVLYEMVTGQLPFRGEFDQVVLYSIMNEQPEPMVGLRAGVPLELERIVKKTIAKNPDERYQHSDEINVDLKNWQQGMAPRTSRPVKRTAYRLTKQNRKRTAMMAFAAVLVLAIASYLVFRFTSKEIEVDDKTVAIMFIENQTGEKVYTQQTKNLIPQIYDKLFANHKNDIKLPSPHVKNQLKLMRESNSYDYKTATNILNDARIKYRVTAIMQKSGDNLNFILETTKPGKHPLVWQETIRKPDTVTSEDFAQVLADWIEACVWIDWHEERIHREFNYPNKLTTRKIMKNVLSKNVLATKAFYQAEYLWLKGQFVKSLAYYKKAWEEDPEYIVAATAYALGFDFTGQRQKGLDMLEQLRKKSSEYTHYEQLYLECWYEYYIRTPDRGIRKFLELLEYEEYPDMWNSDLGLIYLFTGDYTNASKLLEKFIKAGLSPSYLNNYVILQDAYNLSGLWKKALEPLKIGLKRNPDSRTLMHRIIQQYLMLGKIKEANKWFLEYEKASRIQAENIVDGIRDIERHFLIMGEFEKAYEYQQKALSDLDITVEQISAIAEYVFYMGKYNHAENILLDAIERFPRHVMPYISLSELYRSKKDYANMLKYANKAYELAPSTGNRLYRFETSFCHDIARALWLTARNDSIQAKSQWNNLLDKSLILQWRNENYWRMGVLYSLKGDVEQAMENLEIAFEKGYRDVVSYCYDPDIDNVRNDSRTKDRFAKLLEKVKATYPALEKK